jgi:hypothetical protein
VRIREVTSAPNQSKRNSDWAGVRPVTQERVTEVVKGSLVGETTTLSTTLACFPGQVTVGICEIIEEKLEAPPGFEPGVEVLQPGSAITKSLSRLAFWSALIFVLPRFWGVPFPSLFPRFGWRFASRFF